MSVLNKIVRQTISFDASSKKHRAYFNVFLETNSWKDCPVNFAIEDGHTNVVSMISDKVIKFYTKREFSAKK